MIATIQNYKLLSWILVSVLITLISCKSVKEMPKQDAIIPFSYRGSSDTQETTDEKVISWKEFFKEKQLQALIDTAILRNNDLQITIKNIDAATLLLQQSKFGYLPDINLAVTGNTTRPSDNSLNGLTLNQFLGSRHLEDYTAGIQLSWEADIWGKVRNQKAEALASFLQTEEARKGLQTALIANIAAGYHNLLMLDAKMKIARKNEALSANTLAIIKLQYDVGQVTSLALQQAEAQQLAAKQLIPAFEQEIFIQENAISLLLGKHGMTVFRAASLDPLFPAQTLKAGIPSSLLRSRPDVKSAEFAVDRANSRLGIAKASMYPSLTITAQSGINSLMASNWFTLPASLFGNIMGGITQPLFRRGKLKTQYKLAGIEREKYVLRFRQQVLVAVGEVSDAIIKIDRLAQQRRISNLRTETLLKATKNADLLFKNGMANYLEVITAQSNVLQSELQSVDIKRAQLDASVELYRSIGGGSE